MGPRWRVRSTGALVVLAAVAGCPPKQEESSPRPAPEPSVALRDFFSSRGLLSEHRPDNRTGTVAWAEHGSQTFVKMLTDYYALVDDERCGVPARSDAGVVIGDDVPAWQVELPRSYRDVCLASPDPVACASIFDGCATIGGGIFCDARFILRLQAITQSTFNHLTARGILLVSADLAIPEAMRARGADLARLTSAQTEDFHALVQLAVELRTSDDPVALVSTATAPGSQTEAALRRSLTRAADALDHVLVGFVVAHEMAHVEQRSCAMPDHPAWKQLLVAYEELTCLPVTTKEEAEIYADLRGAQLAGDLLAGLAAQLRSGDARREIESSQDLQIPAAGERHGLDLRPNVLWTIDHFELVTAIAMIHFIEVELMLRLFGEQAPGLAAAEPCMGCFMLDADTGEVLRTYYRDASARAMVAGEQRARRAPHMTSQLRYLLFAALFGNQRIEAYATEHDLPAWVGVRFDALLAGTADALAARCEHTPAERVARIRGFEAAMAEAATTGRP